MYPKLIQERRKQTVSKQRKDFKRNKEYYKKNIIKSKIRAVK